MEQIENHILSLLPATDMLGVPLFRPEMREIWEQQKKHVRCLQDPPEVELYTITGSLKKGGTVLPVYRCGRGTTSLECFHLHLNRFIPGTSASAVNFQAYLLEGVTRWNRARADAAVDCHQQGHSDVRTFDTQLQSKANSLSLDIHKKKLVPKGNPPLSYTGELIGMEYTLLMFGRSRQAAKHQGRRAGVADIDEGFLEEDLTVTLEPLSTDDPDHTLIMSTIPGDSSDSSDNDEIPKSSKMAPAE
ncbi:hypothetical protein Bbelb_185670 [Branchiostoma belcheri]|nr:hypothetical protein Bbelb_185670 [Branchiostoma belcheri]